MSDTIVSQSGAWDPKLGQFVTTTKVQNLTQYPAIPANAVDATKSLENGLYTVTYKNVGDPAGNPPPSTSYNYEMHGSVSTEPLLTFGSFQPGGQWALNDDAKQKIKAAEADATLWKTYAAGTDALAKYATFILKGVESFYAPTVVLTITDDEYSKPDLTYLGKIATVANAPSLPGAANWLFSGCSFTALPNGQWRVSREYRASGPTGWDPDLYGNGGKA